VSGWGRVPAAVRRALLARAWKLANPGSSGLPRRHRDALDLLLTGPRHRAELALPGGWTAELGAGRLRIAAPGLRSRRATAAPKRLAGKRPADARLRAATMRAAPSVPGGPSQRARVASGPRPRPSTVSR
jgi:hypothetical protein